MKHNLCRLTLPGDISKLELFCLYTLFLTILNTIAVNFARWQGEAQYESFN